MSYFTLLDSFLCFLSLCSIMVDDGSVVEERKMTEYTLCKYHSIWACKLERSHSTIIPHHTLCTNSSYSSYFDFTHAHSAILHH